jgi:hypothetical protein
VFIAVGGELALFVALADGWQRRSRVAAWAVTLAGLSVSVAGNIGHIAGGTAASRATAAVPPLAAAASLAVGLGVLKRVVEKHHQGEKAPAATPAEQDGQGPAHHRRPRDRWRRAPGLGRRDLGRAEAGHLQPRHRRAAVGVRLLDGRGLVH